MPQGVTYLPHALGSIRLSFENQTAISLEDLLLGTYTISCQGVSASSLLAEQIGLFGNWFAVAHMCGVLNVQGRAGDGALIACLNSYSSRYCCQ